jgi:hypothetical protein
MSAPLPAERSGVEAIDVAIEEFLAAGVWQVEVMDWFQDCYVLRECPLAELRSPLGARGKCVHLTYDFNELAQARGLDASSPLDADGRPITVSPEALGYGDRRLGGLAEHTVSLLRWQEETYSVDFTAAQYGYREFPLVQRYADGRWLRRGQASSEPALGAESAVAA